MPASLYLDDDVHPQLARLLRSHGIDAISILSFRQFSRAQLGEAVRLVLRLLAAVPKDELRNTVRFLDEFRD